MGRSYIGNLFVVHFYLRNLSNIKQRPKQTKMEAKDISLLNLLSNQKKQQYESVCGRKTIGS